MTLRIYLAARYSRREELCRVRDLLKIEGHRVTSRWLEGDHQVADAGLSDEAPSSERTRFAEEDYEDVMAAQVMICFTEPPRSSTSRGGRHVEMGIGIGSHKTVLVLGPRENVFCYLPGVVVFNNLNTLLNHVQKLAVIL